MTVFRLGHELYFPEPELAGSEGLLAFGGDLRPERLILAYQMGIFPWYGETEPIMWWSPDPRLVLFPDKLKVSKSMKQILKRGQFHFSFDRAFEKVIKNCKEKRRKGQAGTWITRDMMKAYISLHELGIAHSLEVWEGDQLAGGLYGIALGECFFGESMFSNRSNASKAGFICLVNTLQQKGIQLIDCQQETPHLKSMGAEAIPRMEFLKFLERNDLGKGIRGNWNRLPVMNPYS